MSENYKTNETLVTEIQQLKEKVSQLEAEKISILTTAQKIEIERNTIMATLNELVAHLIKKV